eukprot:jgi/Bigna1/86890/estExt_fgenesh1_pg.C_140222
MSSVLCEISHDELPFPKSSRIQLIVYFLCCCSILVVTLHTMNFVTGYDPLDYGLIVTDYISIDVWSFIHTFTFVGLGFLVPASRVHSLQYQFHGGPSNLERKICEHGLGLMV